MKKILVFASGNGSNFQAIAEYLMPKGIEIELLTDKEDCYACQRAAKLGIKTHFVPFQQTEEFLKSRKYDLYVLAGYMRILSPKVLENRTFINIHPSLLPKYKGMDAIKQAFAAGEAECGVSVHYVNEEVDSGEIIEQRRIKVCSNLEETEAAVHRLEHEIYPQIVERLLEPSPEFLDFASGSIRNSTLSRSERGSSPKVNVLVVGSGGRENALAWKISQSPLLNKLYLAGANDGFKNLGESLEYSDFEELAQAAVNKNIKLAVIGPELPLSQGITDVFRKHGIKCVGATQKWAKLESSKAFAKEFMRKHCIPTAKYELISDVSQIESVLARFDTPPVLKADGLAAGKGVYLPVSFDDARDALKDFLGGKYGEASKNVVVEEFLEGEELSVISLFNGKKLRTFVPARDYKRLKDNNEGPNTGGMGAYCPVKISEFHQKKLDEYLKKLENALLSEKADFCGVIYSGLMLTNNNAATGAAENDVKVLEYNMRFGDPETQPLMMHLKSDLLDIFLDDDAQLEWNDGTSMCVTLASEGYPENPRKGFEITGVEEAEKEFGVKVFYAGVSLMENGKRAAQLMKMENKLISNGGRVLCVCKSGQQKMWKQVQHDVINACEKINFHGKIFRTDIGGQV